MTATTRKLLLIASALVGTVGSALIALTVPRVPGVAWPIPVAPRPDTGKRDDLGDRVLRIVAGDPFRLERKPSSVPFGAPPSLGTQPGRPARVAPIVSGLIGPPWRAVLEGIPGRPGGVLVSAGDTIGGYRILRVRANSVEIQAPDTLWRLTVRRTW